MAEATSLGQWQEQFAGYIRAPGPGTPANIADERLSVYRELFFNNIEGIISRAFPVAISIIGRSLWLELADHFFARHQASIRSYPRLASEFLQFLGSIELDERYPAFLKELMHYEWLELELDLAEAESQDMADADVLNIVPTLSPVARIHSYSWPVHKLSPEFLPESSQPLTHLLLHRDEHWQVQFHELAPMSMALLTLVESNESQLTAELLAELMASISQPDDQISEFARQFLQGMYQKGIIISSVTIC